MNPRGAYGQFFLQLTALGLPDFYRRPGVAARGNQAAVRADGDVADVRVRTERDRLIRTVALENEPAVVLSAGKHPPVPALRNKTIRSGDRKLSRGTDAQHLGGRRVRLDRPTVQTA